ncbi:DUF3095 domain-containing protein [Rhizobium sp. CSW-27]|uniref:DUF3095 domain-containing protein n=1 Tax=Rhizobium sp. CSW-27 TaxID=2839985 RepID=UPI001C01FE5F|nr:DUF3095 domain-containing protein [Rhizobium sp. CSW-27]MBT9369739.1 DUF3095 domain-containing protein [Rhizobium sp. CSW-27]
MRAIPDDQFYQRLPVFTRFEGVVDTTNYMPLPEGWVLALADIVGSTGAIANGRYKAVNMAGAGVISAVLNAVGSQDYPFSFGGDGAVVALPARHAQEARVALAAMRHWAAGELSLSLRVAVVPVADVRAAGFEVRVARFAASPLVTYAMFAGGGTSWAERQMKAGLYGVPENAEEAPDLTGLSCRWSPMPARNGEVVSIIVRPTSPAVMPEFDAMVSAIVAVVSEQERGGHPVPVDGPDLLSAGEGIDIEARAAAPPERRLAARLRIALIVRLVILLHRLNLTIGNFNTRRYARDVTANSDFRKFDDGLKMTVDVDEPHRLRIEALLEEAEAQGVCQYGLHRQESALMTCFVVSPAMRNHMHFVEGADGGYAVAARRLTEKHPPPVPSPA